MVFTAGGIAYVYIDIYIYVQCSSVYLVAEWIHLTLFGVILPTIKLEVYTFWGL